MSELQKLESFYDGVIRGFSIRKVGVANLDSPILTIDEAKEIVHRCDCHDELVARCGELGSERDVAIGELYVITKQRDALVALAKFAEKPEAPYGRNQLEFANRIIKAIHDKAKAALINVENICERNHSCRDKVK